MIATLRFNLPEEKEEFKMALNGSKYQSILWDYDQKLREICKHGDFPDAVHTAYQTCRDLLHGFLSDEGVGC